jgi:hypothetical protein
MKRLCNALPLSSFFLIIAVIPFIPLQPLAAADLFNSTLTAAEKRQLESGEILIRNIGKAANISLNPVNPTASQAINSIKTLNPSYLAEVIQIRPYKRDEHLIDQLKTVLVDVSAYKGIPYWSVRNQRWFELYSSAKVLSERTQNARTTSNAELVMDPFTPIDATINITQSGDTLFYVMQNNNKLKTQGITAVKETDMQSIIIVFKDGDSLIFYGIGGVKAPSVFFLKDRIETSFMNRIKTFCMYVYEKL